MNRLRSTPCVIGLGLLLAVGVVAAGCESRPSNALADAGTPPSATPTSSAAVANAPALPAREIAGAQHVLVAYKGASDAAPTITRSKADAKKRAEEARKKALDPGTTFEEVVKAYSDDAVTRPTDGKIGNFERYAVPAAFADATFALPVGGISEVVETPRGFHIIKRTK